MPSLQLKIYVLRGPGLHGRVTKHHGQGEKTRRFNRCLRTQAFGAILEHLFNIIFTELWNWDLQRDVRWPSL